MTNRPIKARPTLYAGIQMRSRLEADFARWLHGHGVTFEYEPRCYAGPAGQWLPDFELADPGDGIKRLIEVKPDTFGDPDRGGDLDAIDRVLTQMSTAWLSEPDAVLALAFWTYGTALDGENKQIVGHQGEWWHVVCDGPVERDRFMWPGMNQLRRFVMQAAAEAKEREQSAEPTDRGETP